MSLLRSRARLVAVIWLLCQVASLSAFMPEDCCARHTAVAAEKHGGTHGGTHAAPPTATEPCHDTAAVPEPAPKPGDDCPMKHGSDGAACPMHRSTTGECCGMSNTCDGPNRPLASLFAFIGVLDAPVVSMAAPRSTIASGDRPAPLLCRLVSPDAPPPKA